MSNYTIRSGLRQHQPFSRVAYLYIFGVISAGLLAIAHSAIVLAVSPISSQWLVLAALTLVTGSVWIKIPSLAARISLSEAFVFASVLLFGPAAATAIVALDSFVMSMWLKDRRTGIRSLFNFSAVALAIWLSATGFFRLVGVEPGNVAHLLPIGKHLWPLFFLAASYFLLNSWFVAIALAFERRANALTLWVENFPWFSLNYFAGISIAALLVPYTASLDLRVIGIILPLLLIPYLTYRTSLGRIEDASRHVDQLNELYMSTIEALAMAVDAKDQITHGHIRRVQVYAIELAKRLGVTDDKQLKAIATAALLHDMGKLAIPEHILNKPGHLTEAEFERMKQHAALGADLLSSIRFPYPVVPIVRHHHENWNGNGYPAGIAGTDIPLGARILSVVDCFDALTSDRPYRPRFSDDDAFKILRERRGTMYDPLVVDGFVRFYSEIAPEAIRAGQEARTVFASDDASEGHTPRPLQQIRATVSEAALFNACGQDIAKATSTGKMLDAAAQSLRQLTPATVYALYEYDSQTDSINCSETAGDSQYLVRGLTIRLGERVTGWTAANNRTAINSHASLDLAQIATFFAPPLRSTISTPLMEGDKLIGVLTGYSSKENGFEESHGYILEQVAQMVTARLVFLRSGKSSNVVSFRTSKQQ